MTVVEFVERERARLRLFDTVAAVAFALVATFAIVGAGAWLLGDARWIALPRVTPLLVWAALLAANAFVLQWAMRRARRDLAQPSVAAAIEREQTMRAGALRGVIEVADKGALGRRADERLATQLAARGSMLAPGLHRALATRAARAFGVALLTLAL